MIWILGEKRKKMKALPQHDEKKKKKKVKVMPAAGPVLPRISILLSI